MIELKNASIRRDGRVLFQDVNLQIHPSWKIGLTGNNGTGKSSFFAVLLGELGLDSGELSIPSNWSIGHMAQEIDSTDQTAIDFVLSGDKVWYELNHKINHHEGISETELAHIHTQFDDIHGYTIPAKASQIMAGLGFSREQEQKPVSSFSGGWRMRLNLAKTLMSRADLLLLDEPTNHLDLDAILWLEDWLGAYDGTLLMISHDQAFLDNVVGRILHIENQSMTLYTGNYSTFIRTRSERLAQQQIAFEKQQATRAHLEDFIRRFKAKASKAKQAQSRVKQLERMAELAPQHAFQPHRVEIARDRVVERQDGREQRGEVVEDRRHRRAGFAHRQAPQPVGDDRRADRHEEDRRAQLPRPLDGAGRHDQLAEPRRAHRPGHPEDALGHQELGPVPGRAGLAAHRRWRPGEHPAVERPADDGQQHQQVALHQAHVGEGRRLAPCQHQRDAAQRQHGPGQLLAGRHGAVGEGADQHRPHRRAGGDQRDVERRTGAQRHVLQRVVGAHTDQAENRQHLPALPYLRPRLCRAQRGPAQGQQQREGDDPAQRVEPQRADALDRQAADHGVAGPHQRWGGEHHDETWGELHRRPRGGLGKRGLECRQLQAGAEGAKPGFTVRNIEQ